LLEAGIDIDVFPMRPLDARLWRFVPAILGKDILPPSRVHHYPVSRILGSVRFAPLKMVKRFLRDSAAVSASAMRFGVAPVVKSAYVFPIAWAWAQENAGKYEHIHAYWGNYAATCAYMCHRLVGRSVPFSMFVHASADLYYDQVYLKEKLLYADRVITCSEFNRGYILEHYGEVDGIAGKIHVCYHGLDLNELPFATDGRIPGSILAVGRLDKGKGFDYLLRAAHELRRRGLEIRVELVGDGPEAAELKRLVRALGIADRVTFTGWLVFEQVREAMRRASIFVHPTSGLGDGMPNVLKEAMAAGVPVVASAVAGIPELLGGGEYGVLVRSQDIQGLADGIQGLLADEARRREYALAARRNIERRFDLARNGRELATLLKSTTRGNTTDAPVLAGHRQ
jgi:glycosyltransferase involved in cell wall biosynthesis